MSVTIEGVFIENPTKVWMELQNTRRNVLNRASRWNDGGWIGGSEGGKSVFTMCLANAVRYVSLGINGRPKDFSRETHQMTVAEQLIVKAINALHGTLQPDIPAWNDSAGRRYHEVVAVIDHAIEWVKPHAQTFATVYASDIMTEEELKEQDKQVMAIENQMWREKMQSWGFRYDIRGRLRDSTGRFVKKPKDPSEVEQFKLWIDGFEERGWDKFWDELFECDEHDEDCKKMKALVA
jgi:hypothetical protein